MEPNGEGGNVRLWSGANSTSPFRIDEQHFAPLPTPEYDVINA